MARAFGPQNRPWKWRAVESEENQAQVFALFPPPLEIAKRRDFHIPTAATAILSFPTSNSKKRTRHSLTPLIHSRFLPCRLLQEPNAHVAHARPYPHQTARRPKTDPHQEHDLPLGKTFSSAPKACLVLPTGNRFHFCRWFAARPTIASGLGARGRSAAGFVNKLMGQFWSAPKPQPGRHLENRQRRRPCTPSRRLASGWMPSGETQTPFAIPALSKDCAGRRPGQTLGATGARPRNLALSGESMAGRRSRGRCLARHVPPQFAER